MIQIIFEKQSQRFFLLFELYKQSNANIDYATNLQNIAFNQGLGLRSFTPAWKYLQMEGLIKVRPGSQNYLASITHNGIKAIEEVFFNENDPTYYFPAYREMSH